MIGMYQYKMLKKWYERYQKNQMIELSLQKLLYQEESIEYLELPEAIYNLNTKQEIQLYLKNP